MRNSPVTASPAAKPRETMTMGEASALLGISVRAVRGLCEAYEKNPAVGLPFAWTSPLSGRTDIHGRRLRGHRRPFADAVRQMAVATGRLSASPGTLDT